MAVKWFRRTRKLVIVTVAALSAILFLLTSIANVLTYGKIERFQLPFNYSFPSNQTFAQMSVTHNQALVEAQVTLNKTFADLQREKREELRRRYMDLWQRSPEIFWIQIDRLINADGLYSEQFDVSIVTDVLKTAKILRVDAFIKRYSMKWLLTMEGGQRVLYKPANAVKYKRQTRCNNGCEQPESEVAGFTINRLLGLRNFPYTVGRILNYTTEVLPVATPQVKNITYISEDGNFCISPIRCLQSHTIKTHCHEGQGGIRGVMVYFIRKPLRNLIETDHRDFHRYYPKPDWEQKPKDYMMKLPGDDSFCQKFRQLPYYNQMYEYILDSTIISYITNHRDQKVAVIVTGMTSRIPVLPVMFDHGYGFCSADNYNLVLAAPIYQCCHIRKSTYERLLDLKDNFQAEFDNMTRTDPLYPLLLQEQVDDVVKRINMLLSLVEYCVHLKGYENVVKSRFPFFAKILHSLDPGPHLH